VLCDPSAFAAKQFVIDGEQEVSLFGDKETVPSGLFPLPTFLDTLDLLGTWRWTSAVWRF